MGPAMPSPSESPLWGWRWMVRWYVGVGVVGLLAWVAYVGGGWRGIGLGGTFGPSFDAAHRARSGAGSLASLGELPRVDPGTGLVVLARDVSRDYVDAWNDGVRAAIARSGAEVGPRFAERVVDPARVAADFQRDPGMDVGDGRAEFAAGGRRVRVSEFDAGGCWSGVPRTLRRGDVEVYVGGWCLDVRDADGRRVGSIVRNVGRGRAWMPSLERIRARTSEDGRTLWLRGTGEDGRVWLVTVDLVTGTILQIDPEPAR